MNDKNMNGNNIPGDKHILYEIPSFTDFTPDEIDFMAKNYTFKNFKSGEFLLNLGQEAKYFYFIVKGNVSLQVFSKENGIIELETVEDGGFLGCSWLTEPYKCSFNAVAFTETSTIAFDAVGMKQQMEANHEFGFKMYRLFTNLLLDRFQTSRENMVALYEKNF